MTDYIEDFGLVLMITGVIGFIIMVIYMFIKKFVDMDKVVEFLFGESEN